MANFLKQVRYFTISISQNQEIASLRGMAIAIMTFLVGPDVTSYISLLIIYSLDFMLGMFIGRITDTYSNKKVMQGLKQLGLVLFVLIGSHHFDLMIGFGASKYVIVLYLGADKFGNLLIKLRKLGLPVPDYLPSRVEKVRKQLNINGFISSDLKGESSTDEKPL